MIVEHTLEVVAICPVDRKPDIYQCTIRSSRTIPVETILKAAAKLRRKRLYQEDVTRELHRTLAAHVETIGWHSGVQTRVAIG